MVLVSTLRTPKHSLRKPAVRVDVPTIRARLRAVCCGHLDQVAAGPRELVAQHVSELPPACAENPSVQASFRAHVDARLVDSALCTADHILDVQVLHDHFTLAIFVSGPK